MELPLSIGNKNSRILVMYSIIRPQCYSFISLTSVITAAVFIYLMTTNISQANGMVSFHDIATDPASGIDYRRTESPNRDRLWDELKAQPVFEFSQLPLVPLKSRGAPGVAVFDYDNDGDLDIYVTNGPGTANSLYANQLNDSGALTFIDKAIDAGVAATKSDGNGVCFGDIDNDGDHDLYVLTAGTSNHLFENRGNGRFKEITRRSGTAAGPLYPTACSMGDVNGDGLLDIVIANSSTTWDNRIAVISEPFALNVHNQLFVNAGSNTFTDVSETSGIQNLAGFPPAAAGAAGNSLAIAMVDYDLDGDTDIIVVDDQGAVPDSTVGGVDRGLIHVMRNDGTGQFTDVTVEAGTNLFGAWMGLSFGDLNSDGQLDMFVTNGGDYMRTNFPDPYQLGSYASRWLLGQADGTFTDPGVGQLVSSAFGWGTVMFDYDNDSDTDIIYHGGLDVGPFVENSNPGLILQNDGDGNFVYDDMALVNSTDHARRIVQGVAAGDLNADGFLDLVSVSNFDIPKAEPLIPFFRQWGSPLDAYATFYPSFTPVATGWVWNGVDPDDGTLSVEINSGNGNNWVAVDLIGTVGITKRASVNRDGIGATVTFTPEGGKPVMRPVIGGASYASQNSLTAHFGLGETAKHGTVDILWPSGTRNRLYRLGASEHFTYPEIPCSYDADWRNMRQYIRCVRKSLKEIKRAGIISGKQYYRLLFSAYAAYWEESR